MGGSDGGSGRRWQTLSTAHERAAASAAVGAAGSRNGDGSERLCVAAPSCVFERVCAIALLRPDARDLM
jgi:hypothetical protein